MNRLQKHDLFLQLSLYLQYSSHFTISLHPCLHVPSLGTHPLKHHMSDTSWSLSNPLPAETCDNLELVKKAAHAYAWENGFAIAVLRSAKRGHPPAIRKGWMRCAQGGHHHTRPSEEPALRQRSTKRVGCPYVFVYLLLRKRKVDHDT